jgi:hypothetical protein
MRPTPRSTAGVARRPREVIDALEGAFVQGRLTKDELDVRVGQALAARAYADLAAVTADIPASPGLDSRYGKCAGSGKGGMYGDPHLWPGVQAWPSRLRPADARTVLHHGTSPQPEYRLRRPAPSAAGIRAVPAAARGAVLPARAWLRRCAGLRLTRRDVNLRAVEARAAAADAAGWYGTLRQPGCGRGRTPPP